LKVVNRTKAGVGRAMPRALTLQMLSTTLRGASMGIKT